jgi:uracil-DNA glycosylase
MGKQPDVTGSATAHLPARRTLRSLRRAAASCKGCDLWKRGTQTVFGAWGSGLGAGSEAGRGRPPQNRARSPEDRQRLRDESQGPRTAVAGRTGPAPLMLVGEQPGHEEDLAGLPFVGPAGRLLDRALIEAGIDRGRVYVTNVVKHFKWIERGKRRIHEKPSFTEIGACLPWLTAEIALIRPKVLVCLGATAAQALLGRQFRVSRQRGEFIESPLGPRVLATVHPSSLLRAPDEETRRVERERFVEDLRKVARAAFEDR